MIKMPQVLINNKFNRELPREHFLKIYTKEELKRFRFPASGKLNKIRKVLLDVRREIRAEGLEETND